MTNGQATAAAANAAAPVLQAVSLTKRFGPVTALSNVNFSLARGEIHSLCGENGAGKSTLIKTLGGMYPGGSYEGELKVSGQVAHFKSMADAEASGICVIHQELALVGEMTVAENIFLGREPTRFGFIDRDAMYTEAQRLLDGFGIHIAASALVSSLGVGQQQLVEIAKALSKESRILILDEPSAALTEKEVAILLDIVKDLRRRDVSCVYISHKLDEVFAISDRITVLRDGSTVTTLEAAKCDARTVISHMVGRPIGDLFPRRRGQVGECKLRVRNLNVAKEKGEPAALHDINLDVHAGEVLGIGGLMGAGRSELLMHLFGFWGHRLTGDVQLDGKPGRESPMDNIEAGLVLVTEDRKRYGLVLDQTVGFNVTLSALPDFCTFGRMNTDEEARAGQQYIKSLRIKVRNLETRVGTLSGGNQQKVVLAKALLTKPKVVMLDEPTRGIDVGAKIEIYELINQLTAEGLAVILVSSELPELMGMSDRIVMLAEGRVGGEFTTAEATQEKLLAAAMGRSGAGAGEGGVVPAYMTQGNGAASARVEVEQ
jgi:D-xylose transport system ATP-binding protein